MLLCFVLWYVMPNITDTYQIQQPSLRPKLYDITHHQTIPYTDIWEGVRISVVEGMLTAQCILITYPTSQAHPVLESVFGSLLHRSHMAKNIVFLQYDSQQALKTFLAAYHSQPLQQPSTLPMGVIRAGINVEWTEGGSKMFYHLYDSTGLYPDLDYFLVWEQLMEKLNIEWLPCTAIYQQPVYKLLRKYVKAELLSKFMLCQLNELVVGGGSAHGEMMKYGIQAATLKTYASGSSPQISSEKLGILLLSFVELFGLQQDHLHSASTLYYPLNATKYVNVKGMILPGLLFLLSTVAYLVGRYCKQVWNAGIHVGVGILLSGWGVWWEYYVYGTAVYTFYASMVGRVIYQRYFPASQEYRKQYKIVITAINVVIIYHLAFFVTPLSFISMVTTCMIAFLSPRVNILIIVLVLVALTIINQSPPVLNPNPPVLFVLFPLSLYITL